VSLQILYRPKSLKTFAGNEEIKQSIQEIVKRKNPPASFLLTGLSGGGKTSLGRILADLLGAAPEDYKETNASNDRTLPAIRALIEDMKYTPMVGKKKVILLDECFSGDTLVSTPEGQKRIDEIKVGDTVYNLNGMDIVEKIFINKIPTDRVVRLNKSNGTHTFCSMDHEYYVSGKWVYAQNLTGKRILNHVENCTEIIESVELFKHGTNNERFQSIITEEKKNQFYIEFWDLQIKTNHSYIANGNMVHNCHGLLGASQEALLKALEEPPSHVHFILCTTNPEALKDTFKRRCHIYEVSPLTSSQMMQHLKKILKKEKVNNFSEDVLDKVVELSNGSPGIALKYLDMVIDIEDAQEAIKLLKTSGTSENDVIDICRALVNFNVNNQTRWLKVRGLLSSFKGDAESARRPILGYLNSCLLKSTGTEGENFALIMDEFKDNFYDSGKAGLSLACFKAVHLLED